MLCSAVLWCSCRLRLHLHLRFASFSDLLFLSTLGVQDCCMLSGAEINREGR